MESALESGVAVAPRVVCPTCRMEVAPNAQRCGHCGEWFAETRLNTIDRVLAMFGWAWATLSTLGAIGLGLAALSVPATPLYADTAPPSIWSSLPFGVIVALLLQGLLIGLAIVSFAQRGPRAASS